MRPQPRRPRRRAERGHRHRQGGHRPRRPPGRLFAGRHVRATRPRPTAGRRTSPASSRSARRSTPWPRCRWTCPPSLAAGGRRLHGRPRVQPHRHPRLAGAHRLPDARPDQDRAVAGRLPAPAARPRGAAAARTAAPLPRLAKAGSPGPGPAISELLKQFIAHNRMMTGGFAIHGELVTLTDIDCPVLAVVGEVDDIGQPASVRGIKRAAPQADVYEYLIRAGHFGLVVGSKAATQTWPTVAEWVQVDRRRRRQPDGVDPMAAAARRAHRKRCRVQRRGWRTAPPRRPRWRSAWRGRPPTQSSPPTSRRATLAVETVRTLPRLARLGQINDHTRISLGRIMSEQARDVARGRIPAVRRPRAHLRGGGPPHQQRGPRPDRGRGAAGRARRRADGDPAQRAGRDRRAVAARRRRGADAARRRPGRRGPARRGVRDHRRPEQPRGGPPTRRCGCWCSAAASRATCTCPSDADVIDMEKIDPDAVELPGWYRPNPGLARDLAFVAFSTVGGELVARQITNYRWALSAFGTASAANLGRSDTVYCLTPLHHQSGAAGQPRRRGRRRHPHRAVAGPAAGPVRPGDPPVRRHRGVLHLGDAARGHRRSGVRR